MSKLHNSLFSIFVLHILVVSSVSVSDRGPFCGCVCVRGWGGGEGGEGGERGDPLCARDDGSCGFNVKRIVILSFRC